MRHLALPGQLSDSMSVLAYLHETYGEQIFLSIMNQYTPMPGIEKHFPSWEGSFRRMNMTRWWTTRCCLGWKMDLSRKEIPPRKAFIPPFDLEGV